MVFGFLTSLVPFAHTIMPFLVLLSFVSLVFLIVYNSRFLKSFFTKLDWKIWLLLIIILAANLAFLLSLPHYNKMWTDESMIILTAKNLLNLDPVGPYYKPIGWSFLLSIIFFFFGLNYNVAIDASCVFGALSATMVFFIAYIMTGKKYLSLLSSVIFSLFASHIFWATSAESNVTSMFFALLAVFFCLLYYKEKKTSLFWLSCSALLFACLFRIEMAIFIILFFVGGIMFIPGFIKRLKERKYAICIIICTVFIIINFIGSQPYWAGSKENAMMAKSSIWQGASGYIDYVSMKSLLSNLSGPSISFWIVAAFSLAGLIYCFIHHRKWAYFLTAWLILTNIFIASIALVNIACCGIERFYTLFLPVIAILPIYAIIFISSLMKKNNILSASSTIALALLLLASTFLHMSYYVQLSNLSCDEFLLSESKLPIWPSEDFPPDGLLFLESKLPLWLSKDFAPDCAVITILPEIVSSSSDFKVYRTSEFLSNGLLRERLFNSTGCIVFVQEMICDEGNPFKIKAECERMHKEYNLELNQTYAHYKTEDDDILFAAYIIRKKAASRNIELQ